MRMFMLFLDIPPRGNPKCCAEKAHANCAEGVVLAMGSARRSYSSVRWTDLASIMLLVSSYGSRGIAVAGNCEDSRDC